MTSDWRLLVVSCVLVSILNGATSIRNARLVIPEVVITGDKVRLICLFNLEGAKIYSLKWYRGRHEFYRYLPQESPPLNRIFPFPGISVDMLESKVKYCYEYEFQNDSRYECDFATMVSQVILRDVKVALSGNFSCEVSADAPSFSTAFVSQYMTVVDLPEKRPVISVEKTSFQAGQLLNANCTTVKSRPAANLTFYINDVPVSEEYLEHSDKEMASTVGSWLSVRAPVPQQAGPLRLKCVASVLIFNLHTDIMLEEERPQLLVLSAREQDSSSRASWQKGGLFQVSNVFPFIILWIIDQVRCLHIGQQGL